MQKEQIRKMREKAIAFFSRSKPNPDIAVDKPDQRILDAALRDECSKMQYTYYSRKTVFSLLKAGANPSAKDSDGMTPLIHAAWGGDHKVVKAMLALGADVNAQDSQDMTALMLAAQRGHFRTVRLLVAKGANVNIMAEHNKTALMLAAECDQIKVCRLLLDNGANPNAFDRYKKTARMIAIRNKHWKTEALLSRAETKMFESIMGKNFKMFMHSFKECIA
jgi:ankyrin repeat protein